MAGRKSEEGRDYPVGGAEDGGEPDAAKAHFTFTIDVDCSIPKFGQLAAALGLWVGALDVPARLRTEVSPPT